VLFIVFVQFGVVLYCAEKDASHFCFQICYISIKNLSYFKTQKKSVII
jgi:hypothetical protein